MLVLPALLHRLAHSLDVFTTVVLVQVGSFYVGRRRGIGIVEETLNTGQYGSHVISGTPAVLQDVQTQLAGAVDVRMKHLANELDARGLIGVLLFEVHHKSEGSVFERSICGSDNDGVPGHNIIGDGRGRYASRRVCLHALEVSHQAATGRSRHCGEVGWRVDR